MICNIRINVQNKIPIIINYNEGNIKIDINYKNIYNLCNVFKIYNNIKEINIKFDNNFDQIKINKILMKIHNYVYDYKNKIKIKFHNIEDESINIFNELDYYKNIVMDPNKTPDTYLEYIKSRIPSNYVHKIFNINETDKFPLTKCVAAGSIHGGFFVHICPKKINKNNKNIFMIGKAITYDTGGLDIKTNGMLDMKVDMSGSAILMSVLNILNINNYDINYNIHLLFPIVENMIGPSATKPGSIVKTMNNKIVEITDTDAEGRLCIADALEYIHLNLLTNSDNSLIIDIATLTGNVSSISYGLSALVLSNKKGRKYVKKIMKTGDKVDEYLDTLKLRKDYENLLKSNVADIVSINSNIKAGCLMASVFLNYFVDEKIPWIHLDVASSTFTDNMAQSYGINLLYEFIKNL